jgi:lipoate---protein ligase
MYCRGIKIKPRIIQFEEFDAFMNMALDEAICNSIKNNKSTTTIRFYSWRKNAISIGHFQGLKNEINEEECFKNSIDVVRRRTGGGAVFHDKEGEITYSVIGDANLFPKEIIQSYEYICTPIINALKKIGIDAKFSPINDIIVDNKKISGNAQTRKQGILLQHGTILYKVNVEKMFSLLKVGKEKIADKLIQSVKKRVTCIEDYSNVNKKELLNILEEEFAKHFFNNNYEISSYSEDEIKEAKKLSEEIYKTKEWNHMR